MSKIYKKKSNGRYEEIGDCEAEARFYPHGAHLVVAKKGDQLTRYNIEPDHAAVEAALERVRDAIAQALRKATVMSPTRREYTKKERAGWEAYRAIAGNVVSLVFEGISMNDVVEEAIKVLRAEVLDGVNQARGVM